MDTSSSSVTYSDVPDGYTVKSSPSASSYSDVPEGYSVKKSSPEETPRSFMGSLSERASEGFNNLTHPAGNYQPSVPQAGETASQFVKRAAARDIPAGIQAPLTAMGGAADIITSPLGAAGETIERKAALAAGVDPKVAENLARDTGDVTKMIPIAPIVKFGPKVAGEIPPAIKGAAENLVVKALPSVDEGLLPVTKLAQKHGIPLSMDEVTGSRALKSIQKTGQDLPFSGQNAFRESQMTAWNKGILKNLGEEGTRITPEAMDKAYKRLGSEFDKLGRGKTFDISAPFDAKIDEIRNEAMSTTTKDSIANFDNEVANIKKNIDPTTGTISGEKLNALRARVNKLIRKTDIQGTKELLSDLEDAIVETMTSDPESAKQFSGIKQQYKNFITLEPLVQKGRSGNISPVGLANRVARVYGRSYTTGNAGEIGELARVGRELLPELGGSDTATRMAYGLGSTVGAASHPFVTGGVLATNRGFQEFLNRNQDLINKIIENSQANQ